MFVMGMAGAFIMVPVQAAAFSTITPLETARASALFSTTRQVAASVGVALLATTLTVRLADHLAALAPGATQAACTAASFAAYQDVFVVSAIVAALGVALALAVRDDEADASRGRAPSPARAQAPSDPALETAEAS